jgi:transcriptional regulator with XRE-family HTH domain
MPTGVDGGYLRPVEDTPEARRAIGARIEAARSACGLSNASAFGREVGVKPDTVYRWERGELVPSIFTLHSVASVTGVTMEWLVSGVEPDGSPVLHAWLEAHPSVEGDAATFLRTLPIAGYAATPLFYDLAYLAWQRGLTADEAARAARTTARHT